MLAPQEVQRMLALSALGWGAKRISREVGGSRNTVREYLRQGGWRAMDVTGRVGARQHTTGPRLPRHAWRYDVICRRIDFRHGMVPPSRESPLQLSLWCQALGVHERRVRRGEPVAISSLSPLTGRGPPSWSTV